MQASSTCSKGWWIRRCPSVKRRDWTQTESSLVNKKNSEERQKLIWMMLQRLKSICFSHLSFKTSCFHLEFSVSIKIPRLHQSKSPHYRNPGFLLLPWSWSDSCLYLSTNIPACTACTMLLNRGFSSLRLSIIPICRVKVEASQSRTSEGTASDWMSLSSSSVSRSLLNTRNTTRTSRWNLKLELQVTVV